ncbi:MAG: sigma 54-interacting transcriptional regulator, partial [Proteobacteria bacterium]|nr:sigma 54-interacting transcriptional regulator [Pseudomonadota bacterium]
EKGSFTGAIARRIGKFEEANGGTLLLDEISEMDIRLQAKLLRAIQEREIDRVGGGEPIKVDIRLIATSNRVLEDEVHKGTFREDLLFRLNVITITLPPLRERPLDIDMLAEHFLKKYAEVNGVRERPLSSDAHQKLHKHDWRGNVRELENTMHRAVLLAKGNEIGLEAIILSNSIVRDGDSAIDSAMNGSSEVSIAGETLAPTRPLVGRKMSDVERDLIIDTVYHCLGNRTHAANILGISIRTLRNKLKQYSDDGVAVPMPNTFERASL